MTSSDDEHDDGPQDPASTRGRLLQAVVDIATEHGPHMVTHRSVASRADVTHGLVRHYFGNRAAMIAEAMELAVTHDLSSVRLSTDRVDDFADGLHSGDPATLARRILQYEVVLGALRGTTDRAAATRLYDRYLGEIGQTLARLDVDDPEGAVSSLVFAALDGLVLQDALFADATRTERILDQLRRVLQLLSADR